MRKAIDKICSNCGKAFSYTGTHGKRNRHFFCCYDCYIDFKTKKVTAVCEWCGKEFLKKRSDVKRTGHNFCSPDCCLAYRHKAGETAPNHRVDGEVVYRTIAEQKIGRSLLPTEEIHHIDGNHMNNDPDNLMVLSKAEHSRIHASWKERDKYGRFIKT